MFVMPSSSARCSQLPRAVDKLPFYVALRKLRDHLRGEQPNLDDSEVTFPDLELKVEPKREKLEVEVKQEPTQHSCDVDTTLIQQTTSETLQLTDEIKIKTEDDSAARKQRKVRKKKSSVPTSGGKEICTPVIINGSGGTVCSPYFQPWQQPSVCTESVRAGNSTTTADLVESDCRVKQEPPIDLRQYGCMTEHLSVVKHSTQPPPYVQCRFLPSSNF